MQSAIEIKNLKKSYGSTVALNEISFNVKKGEIFGLLGPNGAGKTTAIDIIAGVLTKDSGEIRILGKKPEEARGDMNIVSSYVWLTGIMTVYENLKIYGMIYNVKQLESRIGYLLKLFKIEDLRDKLYRTLSAGQQTKVSLCKGFINSPKVLLLDECTVGLDPDAADQTRSIIKNLKGTTILFTSHNMFEVEELCDRIAFLQEGKIVWIGTTKNFKKLHKKKTLEDAFIKIARNE